MRPSISLTDISLFVAVYEQRSITAAAVREHATQSGVSQHIRKLESTLGVPLFVREAAGMQPAPAAETYYRACVDLLRQYEAAARDVQQYKGEMEGEVSIGLIATMTRSALAPALTAFTDRHPDVRVRDRGAQPALRGAGACGRVLPSARNIRRQVIERYFVDAGVRPGRELELDVIFTAVDMVRKSEWRTLLPAVMMVDEIGHGSLTINTLASPSLWFDFGCVETLRKPLSPAAQAFLAVLRLEADRLNTAAIECLRPR